MPTGARSQAGSATLASGWTSAHVGRPPLPLEQLLRSGGGGGSPFSDTGPGDAPGGADGQHDLGLMERDALAILAVRDGEPAPASWLRPGFARRVGAIRDQLAPIEDRHLLAESLGREAQLLGRRPATRPGALRVAYALRLLEVSARRRGRGRRARRARPGG